MASLSSWLFDFLYFLAGTLLLSVGVLALYAAGSWVRKKLLHRFPKLSWMASVFLSIWVIAFVLSAVLYFFPSVASVGGIGFEQPPGEPSTIAEDAYVFFVQWIRLILVSLVFSVLLAPLALLGDAVRAHFSKKRSKWVSVYLACWCCVLLVSLLFLLFPWIPAGLAYFLFYF